MAFSRAVLVVLAIAVAVAQARMQRLATDGNAAAASSDESGTSILVPPPDQINQLLTVCNAYSSTEPMTVLQLNPKKSPTVLTQQPLTYMGCQQLTLPLTNGVELEFRLGNSPVGEFTASEVPRQAASLLLVASRKRAGFTAVAFDSHAFANADLAQVAVIDAYRGPKGQEQMKISRRPTDASDASKALVQQGEGLEYGSIAFLNPGAYTVQLGSNQRTDLIAEKGKTYVLLRVGTDQTGPAFPEQLVLYSGTPAARALAGLLVALLARLVVGC